MGKVVVKVKLTNQAELVLKAHRVLKGTPRSMEVDFVVDAKGQKLIPNPEHGDKQMSEEYCTRHSGPSARPWFTIDLYTN